VFFFDAAPLMWNFWRADPSPTSERCQSDRGNCRGR